MTSYRWLCLLLFGPVVMLLETGTGIGGLPGSPGPLFLSKIAQLETYKCPTTTPLAPIEYIAPLLEAAAVRFATILNGSTEASLSNAPGLDTLSAVLENHKNSQMLQGIIQNLSNGLSTAEWTQGGSTRTERLRQEYIILLQQTRSLVQHMKDTIQQKSSLQSIEETKKSLQQADSVRR